MLRGDDLTVPGDSGVDQPRTATPDRHVIGVQINDLSVVYRSVSAQQHAAVEGIDLTVDAGQFVSVVGPSGCGKTTLLMVMAGLLQATSGTVSIAGTPVTEPRPDLISIVFQDSNLLPWRSVVRNVALPLEVTGVDKQTRLQRAKQALALVGLEQFADHFPRELSGGMKQRVAIARSLVTEPSVLLMDEPFAALDEQSRYEMGAELLGVWDRLKTTVVFITHSLSEAIFLADKVIALGGRPGQIRDHFEVPFDRPRDLALMGSAAFAELRGQLYETLRAGGTIRPHDEVAPL